MGSPLAALEAAKGAIVQAGVNWIAGPVTCVFIEPDKARCENLRRKITTFGSVPNLLTKVFQKPFVEGMTDVRREIPKPFSSGDPLFVFIDPFGATGVPFDVVAQILATDCSEVLINLDADGVARIFKAENSPHRDEHLTVLFGDDSWMSVLGTHDPFSVLCRRVLDLYKAKLRSLPDVKYVFPFVMRGSEDTLNYYLVFASHHPRGLAKMKEAMRSIDKSGSYCFSDGGIGQEMLFRFDDADPYAAELHRRFVGRTLSSSELNQLEDFALNETPFVNAKPVLKALEDQGLLAVKSLNPHRKRGSFDDRTLVSVTFLPARPREVQGELEF